MSEQKRTISIQKFPFTEMQLAQKVQASMNVERSDEERQKMYRAMLGSIDLTTLEGSDTEEKVSSLCRQAREFRDEEREIPSPASVCVYPTLVSVAKRELEGSGVRVASVAGAFPAGQSPLNLKVEEVKYAVAQGADEIDMVISRGKFLEGKYQEVYDEILAIRKACLGKTMKVILETGELQRPQNIFRASQLALYAGADFLKTSTGKTSVNATPEAFWVMAFAIKMHHQATGKMVGIKAAGGISQPDEAEKYANIWRQTMGDEWFTPAYFRIGASRLAGKLFDKIK